MREGQTVNPYISVLYLPDTVVQAVRQIYGTVYSLSSWGYPLRISSGAESDMVQRGARFTASMIQYMKENEIEQCVEAVKMYILEEQPYGMNYLEQHGIAEEELRSSSPIRLMIFNNEKQKSNIQKDLFLIKTSPAWI